MNRLIDGSSKGWSLAPGGPQACRALAASINPRDARSRLQGGVTAWCQAPRVTAPLRLGASAGVDPLVHGYPDGAGAVVLAAPGRRTARGELTVKLRQSPEVLGMAGSRNGGKSGAAWRLRLQGLSPCAFAPVVRSGGYRRDRSRPAPGFHGTVIRSPHRLHPAGASSRSGRQP
jgi:hypothetical protein